MNEKKFIIGLFVITIVLIGGMVALASKTEDPANIQMDTAARAEIINGTHDWGQIQMDEGNVTTTFQIKNSGSSPLKLFNVTTSCSCTTAFMTLGSTKSPIFGMHTKSSYVLEVPGGQTADLTVVFDPAFHGPSGVGPMERQVLVETNDPDNPMLSLVATGDVIR